MWNATFCHFDLLVLVDCFHLFRVRCRCMLFRVVSEADVDTSIRFVEVLETI